MTKAQLRRERERTWKRSNPPAPADLGPMGTATADSLREVGLEPPARAAPPTARPSAHQPAQLVFRPVLPLGRILVCAAVLAGAGGAVASMLQVQRGQVREIEYQTQRYLQALYEMEHVTERRLSESEDRERGLLAAVRRIEEAQGRLVRADRRARRLEQKGQPR